MDAGAARRDPAGSGPDPLTAGIIRVREPARRDISRQTRWLRKEADAETADRFALAIDATFAQLAAEPGLGSPAQAHSPRLANTRRWRVTGFPNHLIFYRPQRDGISVVRVLHAARDWKQR